MSATRFLNVVLLCVFSIATLSACGKDNPTYGLLPSGQSFTQSKTIFNNQLDILWVVDNSGSMNPYQTNLVNNFSSFITNFQNKGYDFHIAVTTTDSYLSGTVFQNNPSLAKFRDGTNATSHTGIFDILSTTPNLNNVFVTNATQGSSGDGDERAFSSMREALNSSLNTGFLRPQSFLAVIILSDEDDFSSASRVQGSMTLQTSNPNYVADHDYNYARLDTINSYVSFLDQLTATTGAARRYNVSSIAVLDANCYNQHSAQGSIMGSRYVQLSNATNGVLGSICDASYATSLNAIQAQIASLSSQFFLNQIPQPGTITVVVNGANVPNSTSNGWSYNASANSIIFYGAAVPAQGAAIQINYVPTTVKN